MWTCSARCLATASRASTWRRAGSRSSGVSRAVLPTSRDVVATTTSCTCTAKSQARCSCRCSPCVRRSSRCTGSISCVASPACVAGPHDSTCVPSFVLRIARSAFRAPSVMPWQAVVGPVEARRTLVVHNGARVPLSDVERGAGTCSRGARALEVGGRRDLGRVTRRAQRPARGRPRGGADVDVLTRRRRWAVGPQVKRAADAHVRVLGHRNDIPRLLDVADFFVLMSHREGLSFALVEAMAHGLPAIVADVAENLEAIGDSGVAVPYGDEDAVAAALQGLVREPARTDSRVASARFCEQPSSSTPRT